MSEAAKRACKYVSVNPSRRMQIRSRLAFSYYQALSSLLNPVGYPPVPSPVCLISWALLRALQHDRDRIIHSRAFRRLEYKPQVFLNRTGDDLRTPITPTMEVAGISRGIAQALRVNEDLAERIALAHDLGHSPFGHTG